MRQSPSTIRNYGARFIIRVLELNNYNRIFSEDAFETAFEELSKFMLDEHVEYQIYYPLHSCKGTLNKINLGHILIKKATDVDCNFFDAHYNHETPNYMCDSDLEIGDYFAILHRKVLKSQWRSDYNNDYKVEITHFESLLTLSSNGNIRLGRAMHRFEYWTVNNTGASNCIRNPLTFINNNFFYSIDEAEKNLKENFNWILTGNLKFDCRLEYALKWLQKAKHTTDINDKIVQLALTLEYSINTNREDITKDLKEKSAILYSYDGKNNYKKSKSIIYEFYNLRSKIIHGSENAEPTKDVLELIGKTETIIRENLLLLGKLNQEFSYEEIDQFIEQVRCKNPRPYLKSIIPK